MIAMQYGFSLPADYDMSIIERRVKDKGAMLDHHAPLIFKAYLMARNGDSVTRSQENIYAPFYLWHDNSGMNDFISGAAFRGLVNSFGWPAVLTWPAVIATAQANSLVEAKFATRELHHIAPFTSLENLKKDEAELADIAVKKHGALLALSAFEPTNWTLVRFRLWRESTQEMLIADQQTYNVLHVSNPVQT
jgi:hypothetical protein